MKLQLAMLVACGVLLAACDDGDDGAAGVQGPAGPAGPAGPSGTPGMTGPAGQTELKAFVLSALNDPEYLQSRELNGLDFAISENPDEFDAQF